jgi:imidazoleglycerol-phosphate dehydratase
MSMRKTVLERKTRETEIRLELSLDGTGEVEVSTGIGFFDHMLTLLAHHASFDLKLEARGDLEVDQHHTVEDVGLCLGKALGEALGDKRGIQRYGWAVLPMDEALCLIALDLSGRPHLSYDVELPVQLIADFDPTCVREFLQAVTNEGGITLHVRSLGGENPHHVLEAVFKGLGRALRAAVSLNPATRDIPSTKGTL